VVVTEAGQHEHGEALNADSRGYVYDRNDGKIIGTSQCDKELGLKPQQEYKGLPNGFQSTYQGFTTLSFEEIQKLCEFYLTDLKAFN